MNIKHTKCYTKDYPRPQFVRKQWTNLNGQWDFVFDRDNTGDKLNYKNGFKTEQRINVPFAYQCPASGIGREELCENIWYQRNFNLDEAPDTSVLLHLEGCDYQSRVWVNGVPCGGDEGGYHRQTFDITKACVSGENLLVIKVTDDYSKEKPRGKQRWEDHNYGCWYVDISGLYKTAWIEIAPQSRINNVKITPCLADKTAKLQFDVKGDGGNMSVNVKAYFNGKQVADSTSCVVNGASGVTLCLAEYLHLWDVEQGNLYDLEFTLLQDGKAVDFVESYFGMRQIEIVNDKVLLNGKPLYQRLILDQGYWADSALTPPSGKALEHDIVTTMQMGFNGARKHQKVEDERYLYYADIYGYIVWAEMPSMYAFTDKSASAFKKEWLTAVSQQYNHPCVLCWVPFNESWGVDDILTNTAQQSFVNDVVEATKQADATRPVISNDGWQHTVSGIVTIHHYTQDEQTMRAAFDSVDKCVADVYFDHDRGAFAQGYSYTGQPIMITEFGGTSFTRDNGEGNWGYGSGVTDDNEYLARLSSLVKAICDQPHIQGFCYTQLSDVYQEVNGLLRMDREPKQSLEAFCKVFKQRQ